MAKHYKEEKHKKVSLVRRVLPGDNKLGALLLLMGIVAVIFLALIAAVDILPGSITMPIIIVMFVLIALTWFIFTRKNKKVRLSGLAIFLIFLIIYGAGCYYLSTTYAMINEITDETTSQSSRSGKNVTQDPFNIYITGIDQWNEDEGLDLERSDVNMIVTVSPVLHKIVLTSIPRDTYIPLNRTGTMDKLTHTGIYGVDETLNSVSDWMDIDFDYYCKVNFNALVDIVDAIGGIDVDSPKAFKSKISKYRYKKGINHLKGKAALYYARERAAFEDEDQQRVQNQQQVMTAIIEKITSSTTLLTSYGSIMSALGGEMQTNMMPSEIRALVKMQISDMRGWDVESQRITGEYSMEVVASMSSANKYSVLIPDENSIRACVTKIRKTLNPTQSEIDAALEEKNKAILQNSFDNMTERFKRDDEDDADKTDDEENSSNLSVNNAIVAQTGPATLKRVSIAQRVNARIYSLLKPYSPKKKYSGPKKFSKDVAKIERRYSSKPQGGVIFYGSSSIRKWKTLRQDMPKVNAINHGFGGCTVNDCVYYADRLIVPFNPKVIVFYAGTNDIAYGYSVNTVYNRTIDFVDYAHKNLPDTEIIYVAQTRQPKRSKYWKKMKKLNAKVKNYAAGDAKLTYVETRKVLNTSKDKPRKKYFVKDGLHFTSKGYKAWASVIRPVVYKKANAVMVGGR